ncbi:MAG: UDP-N-acetylmuramate dehydrogenase [Candidatus Buchananbacteria bacterium]|nr:UDP-N-acetylmuramate dehydrogenase [Candidatus Buchananbacteria bacterium]
MLQLIKQFDAQLAKKIQTDVSLTPYTTFKIGGPAKYFFIAQNNEDLVRAVSYTRKLKIPHYILAGGSNLLISDNGYDGLIILNQANEIIFKDNNRVVADAGAKLFDLVNQTVEHGLTGLEWAAGIPGSVGGAIRGNAGAYRGEMADNIIGVEIMRGSKQFILSKEQCEFDYRDSIFKHNNDLIISGEWQLESGDKLKSQEKIKEILEKRKNNQPLEYPSAGCIFKNIEINSANLDKIDNLKNLPAEYLQYKKIPAAWLIEQTGLKGEKIGDAQISEKHANFIINLGQATAEQVKELIDLVKNQVKQKFDLHLEEEVQYLGF